MQTGSENKLRTGLRDFLKRKTVDEPGDPVNFFMLAREYKRLYDKVTNGLEEPGKLAADAAAYREDG